MPDLSVTLGRLQLDNPILVASGTFGYAREMAGIVDFARLGGIIPKTVTRQPRAGNKPPRTVETPSGMLNAIGLDNDGIEHFIHHHLPYLRTLPTRDHRQHRRQDGGRVLRNGGACWPKKPGLAGLELNLSCPNVAGGVDFATDPEVTRRVVAGVRAVCPLPILAKLTPNVTNIVPIAQAAAEAGADAVSLVNTFVGLAIDWKKRRSILGNVTGGLSGPAIKPLALRLVWQVRQASPRADHRHRRHRHHRRRHGVSCRRRHAPCRSAPPTSSIRPYRRAWSISSRPPWASWGRAASVR